MIKVQQSIEVYELDGKEVSLSEQLLIGVDSHWNRQSLVVLVIGEHRYAVVGTDLQAAIKNAQNINCY